MRKAFIALTTATALTATTVTTVAALGEAPAEASVSQRVTLGISPGIVQNGARVARPGNAYVVGTARVSPARAGRVVTVQRRADATSPWRTVTRGTTARNGSFQFRTDGAAGSRYYEFRALAARTSTLPQVASPVRSSGEWGLVFEDQFGGSSLDLSKWSYRQLGERIGSRTRSKSAKRAVHVSGGALHLQVRKDPNRRGHYLNGHIGTQDHFAFTYGTTAARIKFEMRRGQHGGFWMQPQSTTARWGSPARTGAEIDGVEFFGKGYPGGGIAHFLYSYPRAGVTKKYGKVFPGAAAALRGRSDSWWSRYHVFSVDWTSTGYVFRIDGVATWRSSKAISRRPQFLILSLLSSDWELAKLQPGTLPSDMKVDWVRAWQR